MRVVEERVGRGDGVLVAAELLDGFGGAAALPDADEPERIDAAVGERGQLFVGNLVEAADVPAVLPAELREPDVGALGDEHGVGHPGRVGRELLVLVGRIAEERAPRQWLSTEGHCCCPRSLAARAASAAHALPAGIELHPDGEFFFAENLAGDLQESARGCRRAAASRACG